MCPICGGQAYVMIFRPYCGGLCYEARLEVDDDGSTEQGRSTDGDGSTAVAA